MGRRESFHGKRCVNRGEREGKVSGLVKEHGRQKRQKKPGVGRGRHVAGTERPQEWLRWGGE